MRKQLPKANANLIHVDWGFIDESLDPFIIHKALSAAIKKRGFSILQYGDSFGMLDLRESVLVLLKEKFGIKNITKNNICITNGATAAIDLIGRCILQKKYDTVIFEPVYDTAIESLIINSKRVFNLEINPFSSNLDLNLNKLEKMLQRKNTKLLYLIPNFQNPTGITIDFKKRKKILELCRRHGVFLLEDDPYKAYSFDKGNLPENIINLDQKKENTIYVNSLSKLLFPGIRIGMIVANENIIAQIAKIQKYTTSSPNLITQGIALELLNNKALAKSINLYYKNIKKKRNLILKYFTDYKIDQYIKYIFPKGGFYIWGKIKRDISAEDFLLCAKQNGVSFVPGSIYFLKNNKHSYLRLAYSQIKLEDIRKAVLSLKKTFETN